jgi:hypothetical protein
MFVEDAVVDATGVGVGITFGTVAVDPPRDGGRCVGIDDCCNGGGSDRLPPIDPVLPKPEVVFIDPGPILSNPAKGSDGGNCGWEEQHRNHPMKAPVETC